MVNSKHAFWQALVFTVIVFCLGLILGFFLESSRAGKIEFNLIHSEIDLLDEQLRNRVIEDLNIGCALAKQSTFDFADKIYAEALKLEKYDSASKFKGTLKEIHKRYDLLRMSLWLEAVNLKKNCSDDLHTVVYFFDYGVDDIEVRARQATFSRMLVDLKGRYSDEILLIPVAANLDLDSVDIALDLYDINKAPVIMIDEKKKIDIVITFEELENIVFNSSKA